jgi:hypothetical protein
VLGLTRLGVFGLRLGREGRLSPSLRDSLRSQGWPPERVVGGGDHLAQDRSRNGTPGGGMQMRGAAPLGFDDGEVLHVEASAATQVGPEPAAQLVQRIQRRSG